MTTAENGERAILRILAEHLEVTKALLESYSRVVLAARKNADLAQHLPAFQDMPTPQELHSSTVQLLQQVRAILEAETEHAFGSF